jgi:EEF1A lysine methyltransferase 4
MVKESLEELAHPEYWDKRYATKRRNSGDDGQATGDDSFEWFRSFDNLKGFFVKQLPAPTEQPRILHLGCGNSVRLSRLLNEHRKLNLIHTNC